MRMVLRAGLGFLAATQVGVGLWALLFPAAFFAVPWVGMGMAYNAHLMMDYGALSLATAVVLGVAVVSMQVVMIRTALAVYLVFAVLHFGIHVQLLHHLTPVDGMWLLVWLGLAVVVPVVLWVLSAWAVER